MKLYNSIGPNPKVVRMFAAEKGIDLELHEVDLVAGENRSKEFLRLNPAGQLPALVTDDGPIISEITAICEYLDELDGSSALIGRSPLERAETRMWVRRIDLNILENLANGFRYAEGQPVFKGRITLIPHAADDLKAIAQEKLTWLDTQLAGKMFICGERFSLADIMLFAFLEFGEQVGQPLNPDNSAINSWMGRMKERASTEA
tara:strand:+ start:227470 stop:228081 length:612 start_codon:yes stop_codon:yes gene_type:complete